MIPPWPPRQPSWPGPSWPPQPNPGSLGGVPGPGQSPAWLQERLFEQRIVFVSGHLDDAVASQAAAELMTLDAMSDAPIDLYLDSPDGTLEAALALVDTIDVLRSPLRAHCLGQAGGPSVGVLAVAADRSASPHASFRLAQPRVELAGTADRLASDSRRLRDLLRRFQLRLAKATGQPFDQIAHDMHENRHLDAQEAVAYGLVDRIATRE